MSRRRHPEEVALLLAVILKRSGEKRARISEKTLKLLGKRTRLRNAFLNSLTSQLDEIGLALIALDTGGYGLIPSKTLEAAKAITAKKWLTDIEIATLKKGAPLDLDALWDEYVGESDEDSLDNE